MSEMLKVNTTFTTLNLRSEKYNKRNEQEGNN